jgi:hypothetical protein
LPDNATPSSQKLLAKISEERTKANWFYPFISALLGLYLQLYISFNLIKPQTKR